MAILPGSRIRDNGVFGTTTDNPLTAGATTFNSARLADLSTVAGNHALVTLDPLRQFGNPEIVMVTAHTAAATVATIQRGMFGTTAREHPVNTLWVHAAADNDYREVVTSSTRPADQYEGQNIYETDTDRIVSFTGAIWQQDGLFFDPPACRIRRTANLSVANNVQTVVPFDAEAYDTNGMHDNAVNNSRITFNVAGLYLLTGTAEFTAAADFLFTGMFINMNGASTVAVGTQSGTNTVVSAGRWINVTTAYKFNAGDYVELLVQQVNGAATNRNLVASVGNPYSTEFGATWIGRGN